MVAPSDTNPAASRSADEAFLRVCAVVSRQVGMSASKIALNSRLEEDLGIVGDDLVELIDHLFSALNIKPNHFSYRDYVSAEGLNVLGRTVDKASAATGRALGPLTIAMWVQAYRAGQWVEPAA